MADTGIIDRDILDELIELACDGDPSLVEDLVGMFLDDGPGKLQTIEEGLADRDLEKIERAAHALKGSAGNLGAVRVQHTCDALQNASRAGESTSLTRLVDELRESLPRSIAELRRIIAELR